MGTYGLVLAGLLVTMGTPGRGDRQHVPGLAAVGGVLLECFWWGAAFLTGVPVTVLLPLAEIVPLIEKLTDEHITS